MLDSHASRCRHIITGGGGGGSPARSHMNQMTTTDVATPVQSMSPRQFSSAAGPASVKVERPLADDRRSSRGVCGGDGAAGRPSSLSLSVPSCGGGGAGPTTTPMTFASLGLDCMVDGHTGLTPITGAPSQRPNDDMSASLSPTTLMTL